MEKPNPNRSSNAYDEWNNNERFKKDRSFLHGALIGAFIVAIVLGTVFGILYGNLLFDCAMSQ